MTDKRKLVFKRILGFSMASWINALISLISIPIVTKYFSPENLGKINLFVSYSSLMVPFIYLGFDQTYVRFFHNPPGENDKYSLLKLCMAISGLMIIPLIIFSFFLTDFFSIQILGYFTTLIPAFLLLFIIGTVLMRYISLFYRMENNLIFYTIQSIIVVLITKLSIVIIALLNYDVIHAIGFKSLLLFFSSIIIIIVIFSKAKKNKVDKSKDVLQTLFKYAIPLFPTLLLVALNNSLSQVLLKRYMDFYSVGIYSNALTIASIITIVQSGLSIFWTPFVYENYKREQKTIIKFHHIISFIMIGIAIGIIIFQNPIYSILVNKEYWESKRIFGLLLLSPVAITISETLGIGIEISKRTILKLPIYAATMFVTLITNILLLPTLGILGAAISTVMSSIVMLIITTLIGNRHYKSGDRFYKLILGLLLLTMTALLNYYVNSVVIGAIIGAAALLILCLIYKNEFKIIFLFFISLFNKSNKENFQ